MCIFYQQGEKGKPGDPGPPGTVGQKVCSVTWEGDVVTGIFSLFACTETFREQGTSKYASLCFHKNSK